MSFSRYNNRQIIRNRNKAFQEQFEKRDIEQVNHFTIPTIKNLNEDQLRNISIIQHVWKVGDRYSKLAHRYYGDIRGWWIIAYFNQKPTEADVRVGDVILIPASPDEVLKIFG